MKHPIYFEKLAEEVSNLRYDSLSDGDSDETLKRYQDELDELDPPEDIGEYITSYTKNHLVDVHVFQSNLGIEVLVNKRKDISVAEAQRIKNEALALYGATPVRIIYELPPS